MRASLSMCFVAVWFAALSGCDSSPPTPADMSRHGDLSVGTLSCIGIVDCYKTCADTDATCLNDCYYSGTVTAQRLIDAATFNCPATKLCGGKSDAGATQCTPADTSTSYSQECLDCINNADSNAFKAACANEIRDCQNDKASS